MDLFIYFFNWITSNVIINIVRFCNKIWIHSVMYFSFFNTRHVVGLLSLCLFFVFVLFCLSLLLFCWCCVFVLFVCFLYCCFLPCKERFLLLKRLFYIVYDVFSHSMLSSHYARHVFFNMRLNILLFVTSIL